MAISLYDRTNSQDWSVGDSIQADRLQDINQELDGLFARLDERNLALTYNVAGFLTQVIDNNNNITINVDWNDWNANPPRIYIQEVGDSNRFTIEFNGAGYPVSITYA